MSIFDGKQYREEVLDHLSDEVSAMSRKPGLAVFCVGENPVCSKYVGIKKKMAERLGISFFEYFFSALNSEEEILSRIESLNKDAKIDGIMIQMPIPEKFDKNRIINTIDPAKDVDGLRFCCNFETSFKPPVVLAIIAALELALSCHSREGGNLLLVDPRVKPEDDKFIIDNIDSKKVVLVGEGFLVGGPLKHYLRETGMEVEAIHEINDETMIKLKETDIIISAVGKHDIIMPEMVKDGVILIDAGTTEVSGELKGDINSGCYEKSSFYTPVPGGIGPVTVAMLFQNVVKSSYDAQNKR